MNQTELFKIKTLVRAVGIPANILGYSYIIESLLHMIDSEAGMFFNEIYCFVAQNHKTSAQCVEVSIRNAIKKSKILNTEKHRNIFDNTARQSLSNSLFLSILKEAALENIYLN